MRKLDLLKLTPWGLLLLASSGVKAKQTSDSETLPMQEVRLKSHTGCLP